MNFFEFLVTDWERLLSLTLEHAYITLLPVVIGTLIAVALGVATYRTQRPKRLVLSITGVFLTIPSFALFGLMIPFLGLGAPPVILALVLYSLLPITRNTVTGLNEVDNAIIESAQGMGMGRWQRLWRIELPLAWPVILTGIRVTTLLIVGIAAIGAIVGAPGLGGPIFSGLSRLGGAGALNDVLTGTLGVVVLAIVFDLLLGLFGKLTTSRGIQ